MNSENENDEILALRAQYEYLTKALKGCPSKHHIKFDEEYFKKYYLKTKVDIKCECGAMMNNKSMSKHVKSKRHLKALELLQKLKNI